MDLMEKIKEFLNNKELVSLFEIKGYRPTADKGYFRLINIKNNKIERMGVYNDPNNEKRIRFKGENWAFSLNRDSKDNLYLDHLLIGDVEKEEFDFSFRHYITEDNKDKIVVKLVDDKNIKHIYRIKEDAINIERISVKDKMPSYKRDFSIKDYKNKKCEYKYEHFSFNKDEKSTAKLSNQSKEYANNCFKEFLILEKTYISITSYIEKRISFLSACINEASYHDVMQYEIKRKDEEEIEKSIDEEGTKVQTKIYQFPKRKMTK